MNYRYLRSWKHTDQMGAAMNAAGMWNQAVPRVGGLWPGIHTPMPAPAEIDFSEACFQRAAELAASCNDLVILWSGGIDSTLVAALLLNASRPDQKVYITTDAQSCQVGAGYLPTLTARGAIPIDLDGPLLRELEATGARIVSGYHADSMLIGEFYDHKDIGEDIWSISPEEMIKRNGELYDLRMAGAVLERLEPLIALMPAERTAANIGWWLDFSTYWDSDEYELRFRLGLTSYCSFFGTTAFQQWAQQDARAKCAPGKQKRVYLDELTRLIGDAPAPAKAIFPKDKWVSIALGDPRLLLIRSDYTMLVAQ